MLPTTAGIPQQSPAMTQNSRGLVTPWLDYGSVTVPDNHELVLWWAQYLWLQDGNYRSAMQRVASHFMTSIDLPDLEADEESTWKEFFTSHLNYRQDLLDCAYDFLCYGNSFVSLYIPFKRFAICTNCASEQPIEEVDYNLEFGSKAPYLKWNRRKPCHRCGDNTPYEVKDRRSPDFDRVKLIRYASNEIEIAQNRCSLRKEFYWRIADEDRKNIVSRARIHVDDTPMEVLEAVACNGKLKFDHDMILHSAESNISGLKTHGWGIPRSISNFRSAWLQQLTNKADQAIAIDYTLGMRVLSPAPTPGGMDPMQAVGQENFVGRISKMIGEHRNNPASYHTSPFPLNYQFMGGEGGALIPPEKLKFRQQEYLSQIGVPLEYHQMNLTLQGAPMALRLFESYWQSIPAFYNNILSWVVRTLSRTYGLEETRVEMQRSTLADDAEYRQVVLQLMSANQLSPQTALRPYNIDAHAEAKKVYKFQEYVAKLQGEVDEKAQKQQELGALKGMTAHPSPSALQQQQAGQAPQGQAPMGGAPVGGIPGQGATGGSLNEMAEQASQIAQQLATMPEGPRKQQLKMLREGNKNLHSLVMGQLDQIRSQAGSQGQQMLLQPQAG
jgi:hypothetical protein